MSKKVEILDKICGSGKTTSLLKWCENNPDNRYIYVTPSLEESKERVFQVADGIPWYCPSDDTSESKSDDLVRLLREGKNISCTHNLFLRMDKKAIQALKQGKYTLILDEELETIEALTRYPVSDRQWLLDKGHIQIVEDGRVKWVGDESLGENHSYGYFKHLCDNELLYAVSEEATDMMVVQISADVVTSAYRVIVSTYLFDGSVLDCYLRNKGIEITEFTEVLVDDSQALKRIASLIEWVGDKQIKQISKYSLSSSWYDISTAEERNNISKSIRNIARQQKIPSELLLYTFPERVKDNMKITSYPVSQCWLGCTARATNKYRDRVLMIHAYNRFPHVVVSRFLNSRGFPINQDRYALAELVQWVWRSAIRDGHPIKLCIVSKRMKKIFMSWLSPDDQSVTS